MLKQEPLQSVSHVFVLESPMNAQALSLLCQRYFIEVCRLTSFIVFSFMVKVDVSTSGFTLVPVQVENDGSIRILSGNEESLGNYLRDGSVYLDGREVPSQGQYVFYDLPVAEKGRQLQYYGGYLQYQLSFMGNGDAPEAPDIIIQVCFAAIL